MYLELPINTTQDSSPLVAQVQLEGASYQLYFRFNARAGFWRCDIQDAAGATLAAGLAVRNYGIPFNLALYLHDGMVQGLLDALPTASPEVDAGANELGGRVLVYYRTAVQ